jgi:hypothetical protein
MGHSPFDGEDVADADGEGRQDEESEVTFF